MRDRKLFIFSLIIVLFPRAGFCNNSSFHQDDPTAVFHKIDSPNVVISLPSGRPVEPLTAPATNLLHLPPSSAPAATGMPATPSLSSGFGGGDASASANEEAGKGGKGNGKGNGSGNQNGVQRPIMDPFIYPPFDESKFDPEHGKATEKEIKSWGESSLSPSKYRPMKFDCDDYQRVFLENCEKNNFECFGVGIKCGDQYHAFNVAEDVDEKGNKKYCAWEPQGTWKNSCWSAADGPRPSSKVARDECNHMGITDGVAKITQVTKKPAKDVTEDPKFCKSSNAADCSGCCEHYLTLGWQSYLANKPGLNPKNEPDYVAWDKTCKSACSSY